MKPIFRTTTSFNALTLLVASFDPQKPVPGMTYNVFSGTLNPTQSINLPVGQTAAASTGRHSSPTCGVDERNVDTAAFVVVRRESGSTGRLLTDDASSSLARLRSPVRRSCTGGKSISLDAAPLLAAGISPASRIERCSVGQSGMTPRQPAAAASPG